MIRKKLSVRGLTTFVLVYMVLAFGWWAYQMWQQNERLFQVGYDRLELQYGGPRRGVNRTELQATAEFRALMGHRQKFRRMIIAEGIFFTLCLGFGLYVINRSAKREVVVARQHRNFLLSITHELKSPLAAIRLTLQTLCKRELQREQLDKLCGNGLRDASRLQNMVEDLLLAARLEDNWRPLPEPVDLLKITQDCIRNLQTRFPHATVDVKIAKGFPLVQADAHGLTAVVQNLLENAIKYSPEGSPVELRAEKQNDKVIIRVADKGIGIPAPEREAVFEKFYRLGNEETRKTTGTGLGLYIVKQVVEAHGGTIAIADNQPKGTIFTLTL